MEKEELIQKWLANELNEKELEAFKKLDDYDAIIKLDNSLQAFKNVSFNENEELKQLLLKRKAKLKKSSSFLFPFLKIAAVFAILFSAYYYTTTLDSTVKTLASEKTNIELPDNSKVNLNAGSRIVFNKKSWTENRALILNGEAYFNVAKGSTFKVTTNLGTVTVLGTQFNIKQRKNYFEVICYEGRVSVIRNSEQTILNAGDSFLIIDGKLIAKEKETKNAPSWLNNQSTFKSVPFKEIIKELERQYNVTVTTNTINLEQLFTGSFTHNNIETALKSITLPLHLTYTKTANTITLKRE